MTKKEQRKIVGYKCPMDYVSGLVKKGTLMVRMPDGLYRPDGYIVSIAMPAEIVETWQPVYEEQEIKTMEDVMEVLEQRRELYYPNGRSKQLAALRKIMDIADALNGDDCQRGAYYWRIGDDSGLHVTECSYIQDANIRFKTCELAEQARLILGNGNKEEGDKVIRTACGII